MKHKELKLEEIEGSHTLGGAGELVFLVYFIILLL